MNQLDELHEILDLPECPNIWIDHCDFIGPAQVIHEERPVTDVLVVATINRWPGFGFGVDTGIRFRVRRFRHRIRAGNQIADTTACEIGVLAFFQGDRLQ